MLMLSICIASLEKRLPLLHILMRHLESQMAKFPGQVEIICRTDDGTMPTGTKRNLMYREANGKYVCSIDDDDAVPEYYIAEIMQALQQDPDCIGFNGTMSTDGRNHEGWAISKYNPYHTIKRMGQNFHLRYNNHLTPIRREIAILYPFPDIHHGEDYAFAKSMHDANALGKEVLILKHMYEYRYQSRK